jgi:protein-S-isoprenylcysteine O-methyltransferase Ste14
MSDTSSNTPGKQPRLTRSNLRTLVVLIAIASSFFFRIGTPRIVIALAIITAGCLLHMVVKGTLIRNVVLCDKGIYSAIRHPYYLANYLVDTGFCLLSGNVYLLLAYPFLYFWAYGPSMRHEEALLSSNHPEAYAAYTSAVPQVFPERGSLAEWKTIMNWFSMERISSKERVRVMKFLVVAVFIAVVQFAGSDLTAVLARYVPLDLALPK